MPQHELIDIFIKPLELNKIWDENIFFKETNKSEFNSFPVDVVNW